MLQNVLIVAHLFVQMMKSQNMYCMMSFVMNSILRLYLYEKCNTNKKVFNYVFSLAQGHRAVMMPNTHCLLFFSNSMEQIIFFRRSNDAVLPTRAAGGCDLYAARETILQSRTWSTVRTDIFVQLPRNHYGRIGPRSGPPLHHDICIRNGVIEEHYREELMIHLFNHSDQNFILTKGMKIAQLILERIIYPFYYSRWHQNRLTTQAYNENIIMIPPVFTNKYDCVSHKHLDFTQPSIPNKHVTREQLVVQLTTRAKLFKVSWLGIVRDQSPCKLRARAQLMRRLPARACYGKPKVIEDHIRC
jgi:dUTP pyrophosphatase